MDESNRQADVTVPKRPLLQTKLVMPRQRIAALTRPRLLDQLNTAVGPNGQIHPKLTLINGPAGYGKSTLAIQWVVQLNQPVAWFSIDAGDNDEARFLAYLFSAVGTVQEEIGEAALGRLTTTYIYNDTEAILTAFLNDLAVSDQPLVLVLDDYHLIHNSAIHDALGFILDHMPVQLHLVLTSRNEPPLSLANLRARSALNHIATRELRFTVAEVSQFLSQTMGISLSDDQIARLDEQVEGWVTGYQLIALAIKEDVALQEAFSGSQRYLVDYLGDQVLNRQPADIQTFLLDTAILTQFNEELCQHLSGPGAAGLLRQVEANNLFLIPLDAARHWYRYHHLFADYLHDRLRRQRSPADIAAQHRLAAHWFCENDQPLTALEHALAAEDHELAVELMLAVARDVLMFGEGITLRQWIERLPAEQQSSRRRLQLFYAWSLIRTGDYGRAKGVLDAIADQLDTALLWGEWSALRARLAVMTGDVDLNIRFSQKALHKLPADQHMLRSEVAINLGFSMLQQGDLEAAREAFAEAAQNIAHDPGLWSVMFASFYWAQTFERTGELRQALAIYQRGLSTAAERTREREPSPAVGFMHVGLGRLYYQWNRLPEAERHFRQAVQFAERCGDYKMLIYSREGLADLLLAMRDWTAAAAVIESLEQHLQTVGLSIQRAKMAFLLGDITPLQQWATHLGIAVDDPAERISDMPGAYLQLARLKLQERCFEGVDRLLQSLVNIGISERSLPFQLKAELEQAISQAKQGLLESAAATLQRVLMRAEPGGYLRLFLDAADPALVRLLHLAANNGVSADYARTILEQLDPTLETETKSAVQPLSPREIEVLHHLAAGRTNRQIASEMIVSLNTIKAHTRRLYDKLDVRNRTQAVTRARELNLL